MVFPCSSPLDRPLLTGKEIAAGLGVTPDWFYRKRADLEAHGFPRPLIGKLYDSRAVHAWLDARMKGDTA